MGYLAYVLALVIVVLGDTKGLLFNQGVDKFLDIAVQINQILFLIFLALWILGLIYFLLSRSWSGMALGCTTIFFALLPILQYLVWRVSIGLANSFNPSGITDPTKFWALVALTVLLGLG